MRRSAFWESMPDLVGEWRRSNAYRVSARQTLRELDAAEAYREQPVEARAVRRASAARWPSRGVRRHA